MLPTQIFRPSAVSTLETEDLCLHSYSRTDNWQMQFYLYFTIKKNNFFDILSPFNNTIKLCLNLKLTINPDFVGYLMQLLK